MAFRIPLAWYQTCHKKARLAVALTGITFAVVLMFMQLGFKASLYDSVTALYESLSGDLFIISDNYQYIMSRSRFPLQQLYQACGLPEVSTVSPLYCEPLAWKNLDSGHFQPIFVIGVASDRQMFRRADYQAELPRLNRFDQVLYDRLSKDRYGPVLPMLARGGQPAVEINNRAVRVAGLFAMGGSFIASGNVLTSVAGFHYLLPARDPNLVDVGIVQLVPGSDAGAARARLAARLPGGLRVLTYRELVDFERDSWSTLAPIGYIFNFGVFMGLFVGLVIVYQILFADVTEHLPEYATLKAIGFSSGYLVGVVLRQALYLAVLGYLPGLLITCWLYAQARTATGLQLALSPGRALLVLAITLVMCGASGAMAVQKVRRTDPADIF